MTDATAPGQAARDPEAERDHAEWLHWAEGESYDDSFEFRLEDMSCAFKAGMQAERDPQQALPVAVAALRTIAWEATPDGKPIDPSVVADQALAELRRLGYDEESLADAAQQPQPAPELRVGECPVHADKRHVQVRSGSGWLCLRGLADLHEGPEPQPGRDALERLILGWGEKADQPDRDRPSATAYAIAMRDLRATIDDAAQQADHGH